MLAGTARADELAYAVSGIDDPLKANVLSHVDVLQMGRQARLDEKDYPRVIADTSRRAREALRPYGYYKPEIKGRIRRTGDEALLLSLEIRPGPPMKVASADIVVQGPGESVRQLRQWRDNWPLKPGAILDQPTWEAQKQAAIELAEAEGFLRPSFTQHAIDIDLVENRATLRLTLDTGPRFVFGDVDYGEHLLKPGILEFIPRFRRGDPFNARLLDKFRIDLWKTGYFTNVDVAEVERPETDPPSVDLEVTLETETRNSYQGSLGMGTDTGMRLQAQWSRHPMSRNGDRLDIGAGWQQADDEFSIHGNYRLPRRSREREFWVAELFQKFENLDLEVKRRPEDEDFIKIANGSVNEFHVRSGRLKIRNRKSGDQQVFSTLFVQYLNSTRTFNPIVALPLPTVDPVLDNLLVGTDNAVSAGIDVDLVGVTGKGWETHGRRDRAWIFAGNNKIGSGSEFLQAYVGTRRSYRKGERWKFLLRGEIGYTKAKVDRLLIDTPDGIVNLSVTRLPNFYRFKAGGSHSVRGYGFEVLSDNDVGSNNIVTGSAEVEMKFLENWSAAAFVDIGNAFNDWDNWEPRKGIGVGIRWYSIAGPIRVDVAKALDIEGTPWRLHFTIGTPLL